MRIEAIADNFSLDGLKKDYSDIATGIGFVGPVIVGTVFFRGGYIAGVVAKLTAAAGISATAGTLIGLGLAIVIAYCFVYYTWPKILSVYNNLLDEIRLNMDMI